MLRGVDANGTTDESLGLTVQISMILSVLLMFGGIEQNTGPVMEVENNVQLLCAWYGRNLK